MPTGSSSPSSLPDALGYLVIEGVIGAGKTTLAQLLADRLDAKLVLEQFEENPFLERFYEDKERYAFQTQLSFLASRFRQQKDLAARDLFHALVVSDYTFEKDRIFARQTLEGDELQLYETLFRLMEPNAPTADLVVYLRSSPERLLRNIRERGRSYERDMDPDYIARLHEAYDRFFGHYDKSGLLVVNAAEIDFVENERQLDAIIDHIAAADLSGTTRCTPETTSSPSP